MTIEWVIWSLIGAISIPVIYELVRAIKEDIEQVFQSSSEEEESPCSSCKCSCDKTHG